MNDNGQAIGPSKTPTTAESIAYLREKLDRWYNAEKFEEMRKHLAAVLLVAESAERLDRENKSLSKAFYHVEIANLAGLESVINDTLMLASRLREIKDGYSPR